MIIFQINPVIKVAMPNDFMQEIDHAHGLKHLAEVPLMFLFYSIKNIPEKST